MIFDITQTTAYFHEYLTTYKLTCITLLFVVYFVNNLCSPDYLTLCFNSNPFPVTSIFLLVIVVKIHMVPTGFFPRFWNCVNCSFTGRLISYSSTCYNRIERTHSLTCSEFELVPVVIFGVVISLLLASAVLLPLYAIPLAFAAYFGPYLLYKLYKDYYEPDSRLAAICTVCYDYLFETYIKKKTTMSDYLLVDTVYIQDRLCGRFRENESPIALEQFVLKHAILRSFMDQTMEAAVLNHDDFTDFRCCLWLFSRYTHEIQVLSGSSINFQPYYEFVRSNKFQYPIIVQYTMEYKVALGTKLADSYEYPDPSFTEDYIAENINSPTISWAQNRLLLGAIQIHYSRPDDWIPLYLERERRYHGFKQDEFRNALTRVFLTESGKPDHSALRELLLLTQRYNVLGFYETIDICLPKYKQALSTFTEEITHEPVKPDAPVMDSFIQICLQSFMSFVNAITLITLLWDFGRNVWSLVRAFEDHKRAPKQTQVEEVTPTSKSRGRNKKCNDFGEREIDFTKFKGSGAALIAKAKQMDEECYIRKRKERVVKQPPPAAENELLFTSDTFEGVSVPSFLRPILLSQLPELIKSIMKWDPHKDLHTNQDSVIFRDLERQISHAIASCAEETYPDLCRKSLMFLTKFVASPVLRTEQDFDKPLDYIESNIHSRISMPLPPNEKFHATSNRRGKVDADYTYGEGPNSLFEYVQTCTNKNHLLPFHKVKSMIKTLREKGKTFEEVTEVIIRHTPLWRSSTNYPPIREFAWVIPYIPLEVYHYGITYKHKFSEFLRKGMASVRDQIINHAKTYYDVSTLSRQELYEQKQLKSKIFKNLMRSPQAQLLFASGYSHKYVTDHIYANNRARLDGKLTDIELVRERVATTRYNKDRAIHARRDEKYAYLIEPTSKSVVFIPLCVAGGVSLYKSPHLRLMIWAYLFRIYLRCLPLFNWVQSKVTSLFGALLYCLFAVKIVSAVDTEINIWASLFTDPQATLQNPVNQVKLLQMKSILHVVYYLLVGEVKTAIGWGTNFIFTNPELIDSWTALTGYLMRGTDEHTVTHYGVSYTLSSEQYKSYLSMPTTLKLDFVYTLPFAQDATHVVVEYNSRRYALNAEQYASYLTRKQFNTHGDFLSELVFPQSRLLEQAFSEIQSFLGFAGVDHLSPNDIREANALFTYRVNKAKETNSKITLLTTIASTLCMTLFGFDPTNPNYQKTLNEAVSLCIFTENTSSTPNIEANKSLLGDILVANGQAIALLATPDVNQLPSYIRSKLLACSAKLTSLAKIASIYLDGGNTRTTPLFCVLTGPPSVGKSSAIDYLQRALLYQETGKDNAVDHSFAYTGTEFWDGYTNQKFVVMDDMFKQQDVKDRAKQACEIISMVNTVPYSLNMAFDNKGHVFFNSPYMFGTTNLFNDGIRRSTIEIGMSDNEAILRRMHFVIHRESPWIDDPKKMVFTVHVSQIKGFQHLEGTQMNLIELGKAIFEMKKAQRDIHAKHLHGIDTLREHYGEITPQSRPTLNPMAYIKFFYSTFVNSSRKTLFSSLAISLFCVLLVACKYSSLLNWFFPEVEPTSFEGVKARTKGAVPIRAKSRNAGVSRHRVTVNSVTLNFTNSLPNFSRSIINFIASGKNSDGSWMSEQAVGIHIRDRYVLVPTHFYYKFRKFSQKFLTMHTYQGVFEFPMPEDFVYTENSDLCVFQLPQKLPTLPSSYEFFPNEKTLFELEPGSHLVLRRAEEDGSCSSHDCILSNYTCRRTYTACEDLTVCVEHPVTYQLNSQQGDSGSPVLQDIRGRPLVLGVHVGAFSNIAGVGHGLAITIFQEDLTNMISSLNPLHTDVFPHEVLQTTSSNRSHWPPTKSKFRRSPLWGWTGKPSTRIPAKLSPHYSEGEPINPLFSAMRKNHQTFTPPTPIPDDVIDYLLRMYPPCGATSVSWAEALNGTDHPLGMSIKLATSPGYPFTLENSKGKSKFVERTDDQTLVLKPEFLQVLSAYDDDIRLGKPIQVLWADVLKDELRLPHKASKPRLFQTCPLHYLLLGRKYLLPFTIYAQERCLQCPISVGISITSTQADILVGRITSPGGSIIAGDFSNYDGLLPAFVGQTALAFLDRWFAPDEGDSNARKIIFENIWNAKHICYDKIYQVCDGNPSGNPFTSLYNSLCNVIMCYTVLTQDFHLSPSEFEIAVYGDDNLIGTTRPDLKCSHLTPHFMRRFGMSYTHFSKQDVDPLDSISTVGYLGRSFVKRGSFWYCPLPMERIEESCMWFDTNTDDNLVLISMIESMFLEFSFYPKEVFELKTKELLCAVQEKRPELVRQIQNKVLSYAEYQLGRVDGSVGCSCVIPNSKIRTNCSNKYAEPKSTNGVTSTRNEDMTAKAVNSLETTQDVQLGSYMDAAPITASSTNDAVYQEVHTDNNMETFDLNKVLDREYLLANITWTTAQAAGTVLASYDFPASLFAQSFISNKIQDYSFFRAGVRLSVRVAASSFLYGKLMVNYTPRPNSNQYIAQATNLFTGSGYPHVLVSGSATEAAVLDVPFISPYRAIATDTNENSEMGTFNIIVAAPLRDIQGNVGSANVAVTAQFLDAQIWMPKDVVVPTSKRVEGLNKSLNNSVSSKFVSRSQQSGKVASTPQRSCYKDLFSSAISAAATAAEVGAIFGLDKPTSTMAPQPVRVLNMSDFASGRGLSSTVKFAMDPENSVTTKPVAGGVDLDEMDLNYIVGTPMLVSSTNMLSGTPATKIMSTSPYDTNMTYVDFVTRCFKYFSGSYKFKCYIVASTMHSVKLVFWLNNSAVLTAWQDCYHQVVDIQGDTEVEFMVPFIDRKLARTIDDTDNFGIWVQTLSWSQPVPSASTPITLMVYKAGGSDMEFGCPLEREFQVTSNPRADFAKTFKPFHDTFTGYATQGVIYGEKFTSLRDILHRYHPYYQVSGNTNQNVWERNYVPLSTSLYGLEFWGLLFQYHRGSIRMMHISHQNNVIGITARIDNQNIPGFDMGFGVRPNTEVEMPYYSNLAYLPNTVDPPVTYTVRPTKLTYLCKSAGDDFSFHFLSPPPNGNIRDVAKASDGFDGLSAYMISAP